MTVVSGVVTVAVVTMGVVTVATVIGMMTVTVAATVVGNVGIGSVDRRTVGTRSIEVASESTTAWAVDERTGVGVASPLGPCVDVGAVLAPEPSLVLK